MNPKDQTERSPLPATGMGADVTTADRRKSEPKRPGAASATGTNERTKWIARHYGHGGAAA